MEATGLLEIVGGQDGHRGGAAAARARFVNDVKVKIFEEVSSSSRRLSIVLQLWEMATKQMKEGDSA